MFIILKLAYWNPIGVMIGAVMQLGNLYSVNSWRSENEDEGRGSGITQKHRNLFIYYLQNLKWQKISKWKCEKIAIWTSWQYFVTAKDSWLIGVWVMCCLLSKPKVSVTSLCSTTALDCCTGHSKGNITNKSVQSYSFSLVAAKR